MVDLTAIALAIHNAGRTVVANADTYVPRWNELEPWERIHFIEHVESFVHDPHKPAALHHNEWVARATSEGWVFGEEFDASTRVTPMLTDYENLSHFYRVRDSFAKDLVLSRLG